MQQKGYKVSRGGVKGKGINSLFFPKEEFSFEGSLDTLTRLHRKAALQWGMEASAWSRKAHQSSETRPPIFRDAPPSSQPEAIRPRDPEVSLLADALRFPTTHPAPAPSGHTNSSRRAGASRRRHTPPDPGCRSTLPTATLL